MIKGAIFLCHVLINGSTQLSLTFDPASCYQEPKAQQIWVEEYNLGDNWEKGRLSAICGWSNIRCPMRRS